MDKFGGQSWKEIQQIVSKYLGKETNKPTLPKITPILAHAPEAPVYLSDSVADLAELVIEGTHKCSYVATLIKKKDKYNAIVRAYLISPYGEVPLLYEEESFSKNQRAELARFMRAPFFHFKRGKHLRFITFKDSDMTEEDFNNLIELWRTKPSQIAS